jgi:hypothetical protein
MGIQVAAGGEVGRKQAFQESEGPAEPGCPGQVHELLPGQCRHHDPFTVRSAKVAGEAALRPDVMHRGGRGFGADGKVAGDSTGEVFRRHKRRVVPGHEPSEALSWPGISGEVSSSSASIRANSSAAENPGCFSWSSLRTYAVFSALCRVITLVIVVCLTDCRSSR